MLLNTSDNALRTAAFKRKEQQREQIKQWVANAEKNCKYVDDSSNDPTFAARRIGKPMHHDVLEAKLKSLNPRINFIWNQFNSTKKVLLFGKDRIPYEAGIMPERSIMGRHTEEVPIAEVFDNPKFVLDRKDLRKDGKNPWMRTVTQPWREEVRGWRTVLIKLVAMGAITPTQAELMFTPADNPEWQNSMGKAKHDLPW